MIQLTADEIDMPLARMSSGNTSAETTHASGPHVTANQVMYLNPFSRCYVVR